MDKQTTQDLMRINASLHAKRYGHGLTLNQVLLLDNAIKNLESILRSEQITDQQISKYIFERSKRG